MTLLAQRASSVAVSASYIGTQGLAYGIPILNRLRHGIAVLNSGGVTLFRNAALDDIVRRDCGLRYTAGRLHAVRQADNARLQAAIGACTVGCHEPRSPSDVSIWGPRGEHSLVVSALPVEGGDGLPALSAVLLLVVDTEPSVGLDHRFLRATFHFSEAECHIATRLLEGVTLAEIAEDRGITIHTARSQLKSIMQKAGVSRQGDLINLLSRCDTVRRA